MKTAFTVAMCLAMAAVFGCNSPQGGGMSKDEGFKISGPMLTTEVKQGDRQTVTVSLKRDNFFKQDVTLRATATSGIKVEPASILVKANESPDVTFQIKAPKDAALGEYLVHVIATPEKGAPTAQDYMVKVIAP